jgi:pyridoxamine 5'-phosphate oxidase
VDEHDPAPDPLTWLRAWLTEAAAVSSAPQAMTLPGLPAARGRAAGRPWPRIVLLRGVKEHGLVFFTNRASRKGEELAASPRAALVLHWWELGRQVRVEGTVEEVEPAKSEEYWATRPRESRIAAWASSQSQPIASRAALEAAYAAAEDRFRDEDVPLPSFWGGYRVAPEVVEFWTHRENRLHDRIRYVRSGDGWRRERLAP